MSPIFFPDDTTLFLELAATDSSLWRKMNGVRVNHPEYGEGMIGIILGHDSAMMMNVMLEASGITMRTLVKEFFDLGKVKRFPRDVEGILNQAKNKRLSGKLGIPLDEFEAMKPNEIEEAVRFYNLKDKYHALSYKSPSPLSGVCHALSKIDSGAILNEEECELLKNAGLFVALAVYFDQQYNVDGDIWNLVKSSRTGETPRNRKKH